MKLTAIPSQIRPVNLRDARSSKGTHTFRSDMYVLYSRYSIRVATLSAVESRECRGKSRDSCRIPAVNSRAINLVSAEGVDASGYTPRKVLCTNNGGLWEEEEARGRHRASVEQPKGK